MLNLEKTFSGKWAVITGASRGIGKAAACEFIKAGGNVCIVARNTEDLKKAADELKSIRLSDKQQVVSISSDTTDMNSLKPELAAFVEKNGVPDYLMNFVGYAGPRYIQDLKLEDFKKNMDVNYYGQLVPILILLPYFMEQKKGHILNTSSVSGYLGIMGYATYTPTKFAIAGLTESLRHELLPYNIRFSVLYPPDTDTPGFEKENITKPPELSIISEGGGLLSPEKVANTLLKKMAKKKFYILPGQSRLLWTLMRHFPGLSHYILDGELKKAIKKTRKKIKKDS